MIQEAKRLFLSSAGAGPRGLQSWTNRTLLCETLYQTNQYYESQQDWGAHLSRGRGNTVGAGCPVHRQALETITKPIKRESRLEELLGVACPTLLV